MSQECRQSCSKPEKLLATLNWPWNKTVIASQIFQYQHHHIPLSLQPFSWLTHHRWKQKDYRQIMVTDKNWLRYAQFPCWCVYPASMDMRPRSDQSSHPGWEVQVGCLLSAVICGADCFIMKCSSIKAWPWGQGWGDLWSYREQSTERGASIIHTLMKTWWNRHGTIRNSEFHDGVRKRKTVCLFVWDLTWNTDVIFIGLEMNYEMLSCGYGLELGNSLG